MKLKPIVVIHVEEPEDIPSVYFNGEAVEVIWVTDYAPDDRFYRMAGGPIPAGIIEGMTDAELGSADDKSAADLRLNSFFDGGPNLTVVK